MTLRTAIYARVSTDRQRERHTIDSQLRLLPEYAAREGWEVINVYKDDGLSGETVENRPAFRQLVDDAAEKLFDVVLVIDLDRITRSRKSAEGALIFDHFREHGIKIATPSQGLIDLADEDQDLLVGIKREVAKWEKRKIIRRMMRGKREAALKGRRFFCLDPYGLKWVKDLTDPRGGTYQIEPSEGAVVRLMYQWALDGLGKSMIVWRLNSEGHRTRAMKRGSRPDGGPGLWAPSTVAKLLRSPTYKGEFRVFKKDDNTAIAVPPIVSAETWERTQTAIAGRKPEARWKHDRKYLLSGHVRCGVCGHAMWVVNARPGRTRHAYYRCETTNAWRKLRLDGPCGNKHHRVDKVDDAVWLKLTEVLRNPALLAEACSLGARSEGVDWEGQAKGARRKVAELEKLESDTLKRHRRGLISGNALDRELSELSRERSLVERNLRMAEDRLRASGAKQQILTDLQSRAAALSVGLDTASFEERRSLVRLLLPAEHECHVKLHETGAIEILGILPAPSASIDMRLVVSAG